MRMNEVPVWAWISVVCKFAESTTVRSLYPYVSSLADTLGVSPKAVALCISLCGATVAHNCGERRRILTNNCHIDLLSTYE